MSKPSYHPVPRHAIFYCPLCGLVADVGVKGKFAYCHGCGVGFAVWADRILAVSLSEKKAKHVCTAKGQHLSLESAYEHWLAIKDKPIHNCSQMMVYLCDLCGLFHLGHEPSHGGYHAKMAWTIPEVEEEIHRTAMQATLDSGGVPG